MAYSVIYANGDGSTKTFPISFPLGFISRSDVKCRVDDEVDGTGNPAYRTLTWISDGLVTISGDPPPVGVNNVRFYRTVSKTSLVHDYTNGAAIEEKNLDDSNNQLMMALHEFMDGRGAPTQLDDKDMNGHKIVNLIPGTASSDAATYGQVTAMTSVVTDAADAASLAQAAAESAATSATTSANAATVAAVTAGTNADTATTQAAAAQLAAQAAQDAANSVMWSSVLFLTAADSPVNISALHDGSLINIDTSAGPVTVNLPLVSTLMLPFNIAVKKTTADGNSISVVAHTPDTIDGGATKTIAAAGSGSTLVAEVQTEPDAWVSADFGAAGGNMTADVFSPTAGQTTFTLSVAPGSANNAQVSWCGVRQYPGIDYTVNGSTLTFTFPLTAGTNTLLVVSGTTLAAGIPSDGSVTNVKTAFTTRTVGDATTQPATTAFSSRVSVTGYNSLKGSYTTNTTATYTAFSLLLLTAGGDSCRIMSYSHVLNTALSGLGGLDSGSLAVSTWYYVFAIYNATTQTDGIIFSRSPTSPTLPSGYNHYLRIGSFFSDASRNIRGFTQYGDRVSYKVGSNLSTLPIILTGATGSVSTGTYSAISISNFVPATASTLTVVGWTTSVNNSEILVAPNGNYGSDTSSNPALLKTYSLTAGFAEIVLESTNIYVASQSSTLVAAYSYRENF